MIQLAFRQTVHYYGTDLCWTPMILAKEFNRSAFARDGGTIPNFSFLATNEGHESLTFADFDQNRQT